jgi:hypothetical protein
VEVLSKTTDSEPAILLTCSFYFTKEIGKIMKVSTGTKVVNS